MNSIDRPTGPNQSRSYIFFMEIVKRVIICDELAGMKDYF